MATQHENSSLYVVRVEGGKQPDAIPEKTENVRLSDGLFLVRTSATQSQLYHTVKRRAQPDVLFVARLDGAPKFKGMTDSALKWVRSGQY
ncbi:MAG TPA: hypothetical protein VMW68_06295 [Methyloceanibacter sp.]|nr:hypothetical protein [Methyloceanibacter sp.]